MFNFGTGKLIAVPTNDSTGAVIANATPVQFGTLQECGLDISADIKTLRGSKRFPLAVGQGQGKIELSAKNADIDGGAFGSLFFGKTPSVGIKGAVMDSPVTVPDESPYTVTVVPPNSGEFVNDLGVVSAATGDQLKPVSGTPATGQYSVDSDGKYTFAAADAGAQFLRSYEYSSSSGGKVWTITNDLMGYTPSFTVLLQNSYDGKTLVCKLNRAVSGKFSLPLKSDDFTITDFSAEAFADAAGNVGYICLF